MTTHCPIRSFVRREGRMTQAQKNALGKYWQLTGISLDKVKLDFDKFFSRPAELILEIGFGMGDSLVAQARQTPEKHFIGIEVHRPGIGAILKAIHEAQLKNIKVICADASDVLKHNIPDNTFGVIQIFFPDPWPKKRHHKRRLIQSDFVKCLHQKLKLKGLLHIVTDWQNYAEHIEEVIAESQLFSSCHAGLDPASSQPGLTPEFQGRLPALRSLPSMVHIPFNSGVNPSFANRPETKFEKRGKELGHAIWEFQFQKK